MKFKFLLIGLLVVFSSVGSYAQDYISFDITSVTLTENNWGDAGDNSAELMIIAISESYSGKRTKLTIPSEGSISASLNSRISLEEYSGLHIPIGKDIVRVYLFAFDADQINSALGIAGDAFIKLTTKMIATNAWKYFKTFKKSNFYSLVAGEAVGLGYEEAKKYIEENDDLGRAVVELHRKTVSNDTGVVYGIEKGIKFTYKIKLESGESDDSSYASSTQTNNKWITPSEKGMVTWSEAKKICSNLGGRLPTLDELKRVVIDCGGKMEDDDSDERKGNRNNSSYQSCYQKKGFTSSYYWSSTTYASDTGYAWVVYFYGGYTYYDTKSYNSYVRCVRAGQ